MMEINDPSLHLEYFKKCADLGKPIFLDKPLKEKSIPFTAKSAYTDLVREIGKFFSESKAPIDIEDTLEVMSLLDSAEISLKSGKVEEVKK